jgi:PAS domain S-box-containing protein
MKEKEMNREQLLKELADLRSRVAELEKEQKIAWLGGDISKDGVRIFGLIFEESREGILVADIETQEFRYANPSLCRMLGYTMEELIGMKVSDIHPKESLKRLISEFEAHARNEKIMAESVPCLRKDGSIFYADLHAIMTMVGGRQCNIGFFVDISDRKQAEEALKESETKFRMIVEGMTSGIVVYEAVDGGDDFVINKFNRAAEEIEENDREDVIGKRVTAAFPGVEECGLLEALRRVWKTGQPESFSLTFYRDRRISGWRDNFVYKLPSGEIVAIYDDTTDRERARALSRIQLELAQALSSTTDLTSGIRLCLETALTASEMDCGGVYLVDKDTGALTMILHQGLSPEFLAEVSSYPPESFNSRLILEGKPVYTEYGKSDIPENLVQKREGLKAIAILPLQHEERIIACINVSSHTLKKVPDYARSALETIAAQSGNAIARLEAEAALRHAAKRYRDLYQGSRDAYAMVNMEGRELEWNRAFEEMLGYTGEELSKLTYQELTPGRWWAREEKIIREQVLTRGYSDLYEKEYRKKDGTIIPVELRTSLIRDDAGEPAGMYAFMRNIADRKEMELELQKAQKLESLGVLAGGIAHDFNNALMAIIGYLSLAKQRAEPNGEIYRLLSDAEIAFGMARKLTRQLLTFSKGGKPVKTVVQLSNLIEESVRFSLSGSQTTYTLSLSDDLSPVEADPGQIEQVINNLIINANQAMPGGGVISVAAGNITVAGKNESLLESGPYVRITIRDNGTGIPDKYISRIFDPYFTTKKQGSGLGLASAYSIIKNHGGLLTVESDPGGTSFFITLPSSSKKPGAAGRNKGSITSGKGNILFMDDDEMIRNSMTKMIEYLGYRIETAATGKDTIDKFRRALDSESPFDIIILDLTIRGGPGGEEVIKALLKIDPEVKALVSSGYATHPILADYKKYGFRGVMEKPYRVEELSEILSKYCGQKP